MNQLSRIPLWFWYLFSVLYCYVLWNPFYSLTNVMTSNLDPAMKMLAIVVAIIVGSLYIVEGHRTMNIWGIALFFALIGSCGWLAHDLGIHQSSSIQWWGQWIAGMLLTLALQGGRIWRALTGRVPVGTTIVDEDHHHG